MSDTINSATSNATSSATSPLVSVILPTYNRVQLLGRSITSVLAQSYGNLELIVVDDASTDGTDPLVCGIRDARIRFVRHACRMGTAAARNRGIAASAGAYVAFQDSDDVWLPGKLERQLVLFERTPSLGVVYSRFYRVKGVRRTLFPPAKVCASGDIRTALLKGNLVTTQSAMVRRACFDVAGGFDEHLPCLLDWDLFLRLSTRYEFGFVDDTLVEVHYSPDGISAGERGLLHAYRAIVEKHEVMFQQQPAAYAAHWHAMGHLACRGGDTVAGRSALFRAARLTPWRVHYWLTALISLLGARPYRAATELRQRLWPEWY